MKANQNTLVEGLYKSPNITNGQAKRTICACHDDSWHKDRESRRLREAKCWPVNPKKAKRTKRNLSLSNSISDAVKP